MSTPLVLESQRIGLELHALLYQVDPARWRAEAAHEAESRLHALGAMLERSTLAGSTALHRGMAELHALVSTCAVHAEAVDPSARWQAFREQAEPLYGALSEALRAHDIHLPMLRPTNYLRNVQHVASAFLILLLLHHVLPSYAWRVGLASSALAVAVVLEVGRYLFPPMNRVLMRLLGRIAHPHESHRVNSSSWFILALFVLSFFDLVYGTVALAILGAADPAAAVIGRRFGRRTLVHGRTVEGTLAFWAVGTVASATALWVWFDYPPDQTLVMSATASAFAAVAELFSRRIDDNLAIPVAAAFGLWLVL